MIKLSFFVEVTGKKIQMIRQDTEISLDNAHGAFI